MNNRDKTMKNFLKLIPFVILGIILIILDLTFTEKTVYRCQGVLTLNNSGKADRIAYVKTDKFPYISKIHSKKWGNLYFEILSEQRNYIDEVVVLKIKSSPKNSNLLKQDNNFSGRFYKSHIMHNIEVSLSDKKRYSATCLPFVMKN